MLIVREGKMQKCRNAKFKNSKNRKIEDKIENGKQLNFQLILWIPTVKYPLINFFN